MKKITSISFNNICVMDLKEITSPVDLIQSNDQDIEGKIKNISIFSISQWFGMIRIF